MNDMQTVKEAMKIRGVSQPKLTKLLGLRSQGTVGNALSRPKGMLTSSFARYLSVLGYEVVVRDKISGKEIAVIDVPNEDPQP